jgi:zinc protease
MKTLRVILLLATLVPGAARAQEAVNPAAESKPATPPVAGRGGRGAAAAATTSGVASPRDLKYPPLGTIHIPDSTVFTLPNGMKVSLTEDHELPMVNGQAVVRTGGLLDPAQRIGLAQLTGMAMRTGGAAARTGEQVDTMLENLACTLDVSIGDSSGTLSFSGLKENAPALLQLFKDILTRPGLRPDKVDIAKSQLRVAVAHRNDNAQAVAHREFGRLIYGKDSPYGWRPEYATVDRVFRGDVRAFHQRYFFPANVALGVWGDFKTSEMKAAIEQMFADWTVQQPPVDPFAKATTGGMAGVYLVEKKDAAVSYFSLGHLGGRRDDRDMAALEILNGVLGGGSQSRIASALRTKLNVTSDVTAAWNAGYAQPGLFEISGSTPSFSTVAAIKSILEEIERVRTAEVSDEECRRAREMAVNRMVLGYDSSDKLLAHRILLDYYGYPKDYLQQYQRALQAVTRADLLRVAKQYLNPANLTIVVAANPTLLGEPLEKLGNVAKLDISIPEARRQSVEGTDATLAQGRQILLKAQAAAGGAGLLSAIKDYTMVTEYQLDVAVAGAGGSKMLQTDRWVAPSNFRQDAILSAGRISMYTDGKTGWMGNAQGITALPPAQHYQITGDLFRVYYRLLLSDRLEGRTVVAIDESSVQISDGTEQDVSVEFDPVTYLPRRVAYNIPQVNGASVYAEELWADFRDVAGLKIPFQITLNQGGRRFADGVVKDYQINTGLSPQELSKRPQ